MQLDRRHFLISALSTAALTGCPREQGGMPSNVPAGEMTRLSGRLAGIDRESALYIPSSYDSSKATPLVLGTHGGGGTGGTVFKKYGWAAECERRGWIGVFPNSDLPGRTDSGDNDYFDHLMNQAAKRLNVDEGRIWGTGFSGGCHRQYLFAVKHDWVKAIGVVGGAISHGDDADRENPVTNKSAPISVLHLHGASDTSIPMKGGMLDGKDGIRRALLSVRDGIQPWIDNIKGVEVKQAKLPSGCPSTRGFNTYKWEGVGGHTVQVVVDPDLSHNWPMAYATSTIADWFASLPSLA